MTTADERARIEHVIVLMMENRSFDHMLGYLRGDTATFPGIDPNAPPTCPADPARPNDDPVPTSADAEYVLHAGPDHSHESAMFQIFGRRGSTPRGAPNMHGFVKAFDYVIRGVSLRHRAFYIRMWKWTERWAVTLWNVIRRRPRPTPPKAADIMKCFSPAKVPVLSRLATEFAVCTNWFSSVPGETWPNRNYAHAATSDGEDNIRLRFYTNQTIFEQLTSWGIYHDGVAQVWAFPNLWIGGTARFHSIDTLLEQIRDDALPSYAFVEPNHGYAEGEGNSQHPANNLAAGDSFVAGEALIATIFDALVDSPDAFAKTLLVVTYDEHGGFYDSALPVVAQSPDGLISETGFEFGITGVRVPTVLVSPFIPPNTVVTTIFDHASIPKTVRQQFAADLGPLTARDRDAKDFIEVLPFLAKPRTDIPKFQMERSLARLGPEEGVTTTSMTDFQASLIQLAGAVKTIQDQPYRAELSARPPFSPPPHFRAAAKARTMPPPVVAEVNDIVARFNAPSREVEQ